VIDPSYEHLLPLKAVTEQICYLWVKTEKAPSVIISLMYMLPVKKQKTS